MFGLGRRTNPHRAFGDAIYLSEYWSREASSSKEIAALLVELKKHQIFQCYFDVGSALTDGSVKYPEHAETFMWEADEWCGKNHYPMKFVAWLRRGSADLRSDAVIRNLTYCMKYLQAFKGVHLDFELDGEEQGPHFTRLLEVLRRDHPQYAFSVLAQRGWLKWRGFAQRLGQLAGDVEVGLFDSGKEGETYALWCQQQVAGLVGQLSLERLLLGVPAFTDYSDRHRKGETLVAALHGLKAGLRGHGAARVRVAIYREGQCSREDWRAFDREWAR